MNNPYADLPPERYWRTGVAEQHPLSIEGLYKRKFSIPATVPIATAGSCFAQHIGSNLRSSGYNVLDVEPAPAAMDDETARMYGYRIYSARYGNVYTAKQLLQLSREALGIEVREDFAWRKDGRWFDALRPGVEPSGLDTQEELIAHRMHHLSRVRDLFNQCGLFIFTLGLTEAWRSIKTGTVFPIAPGVIAGEFDPHEYEFVNFTQREVLSDLIEFRRILRSINKNMKFLLTVSPVPLTATATNNHVLVATTYSKSTLRAAAGEMASRFPDVDYFPSYELIASPFARGFFFSTNLRSVEPEGVRAVMRVFFSQHQLKRSRAAKVSTNSNSEISRTAEELVCEESFLEAFSK